MCEETFQIGYALGRHWALRDATPKQLVRVKIIGDGMNWVAVHDEPAIQLTSIIDPDKSGFMGTDETPSAAFVAGFIDGAQSVGSLH